MFRAGIVDNMTNIVFEVFKVPEVFKGFRRGWNAQGRCYSGHDRLKEWPQTLKVAIEDISDQRQAVMAEAIFYPLQQPVNGGARGGNGPWRVKSNSQPAVVPAGPVPESNSFAALQCPENDTPSGPSDGVGKNDASDLAEPDLGPTLNGVEKDIRILTPSVLERENRGESLLKNDDSGHDCSSRDMRGIICISPLPEGDQMGGGSLHVPPTWATLLFLGALFGWPSVSLTLQMWPVAPTTLIAFLLSLLKRTARLLW
ncbi:hypothetical protein Nepgr_004013 [Nepenthes gracilis]|uniref:Uncharacterized protein n=1 Tax=Nepenthes gracilis TaxID=150966 RepID=A0AAD3XEH7_NEPGR|nr:hypothetical protein Nepgr_004013 [Nepenthes gracilis]